MPQFFIKISNITDNMLFIDDKSDIKHITAVLRLSKNNELVLTDENHITHRARIVEVSPHAITAEIIDSRKSEKTLKTSITLAQSILKSAAQDMVIQKATELGVREVIPLLTRYTVVKLQSGRDVSQKLDRWQKIAYESCKQCERADIPEVRRVLDFNGLIELRQEYDIVFACVERNAERSIKEFLRGYVDVSLDPPQRQTLSSTHQAQFIGAGISCLVIIGPEGGWSDDELAKFKEHCIAQVSLGNLILRAETASITALADIIYEFELD